MHATCPMSTQKASTNLAQSCVRQNDPKVRGLLTLCKNAAALGGEHLLFETRHGKEAAEPSTEPSDGLMHRRVRWPRRWGLGPSLPSTGTIQLLRAPSNARLYLRRGTSLGKN